MSESKIRVGDKFLVEVEVVTLGHIGKDFMLVRGPLSETYGTNTIHREQLLLSKRIEPPLKAGDEVRMRGVQGVYTILHIHLNCMAWLIGDSGGYCSSNLSDLERVP